MVARRFAATALRACLRSARVFKRTPLHDRLAGGMQWQHAPDAISERAPVAMQLWSQDFWFFGLAKPDLVEFGDLSCMTPATMRTHRYYRPMPSMKD